MFVHRKIKALIGVAAFAVATTVTLAPTAFADSTGNSAPHASATSAHGGLGSPAPRLRGKDLPNPIRFGTSGPAHSGPGIASGGPRKPGDDTPTKVRLSWLPSWLPQ